MSKYIDNDYINSLLPWKHPVDVWSNDGMDCEVLIDGHNFKVESTGQQGIHTGRQRYKVMCTTCSQVIHEATTSASARIQQHLMDTEFNKES